MNAVRDTRSSSDALRNPIPLILLSGDNAQTASHLSEALTSNGFAVQLAPHYSDVEALWRQQHESAEPVMVLLEVSGQHSVESAVDTALQLKRHDPYQFVGYVADPMLESSGLAGDAIFPRSAEQLAAALRLHFLHEEFDS